MTLPTLAPMFLVPRRQKIADLDDLREDHHFAADYTQPHVGMSEASPPAVQFTIAARWGDTTCIRLNIQEAAALASWLTQAVRLAYRPTAVEGEQSAAETSRAEVATP